MPDELTLHRTVGRSSARGGLPAGPRLRLRRTRTRLLGRPLRGGPGALRARLSGRAAAAAGEVRAPVLGHLQPPGRPGRMRLPHRRAPPGHRAGPDLGRRRPGGAAAGGGRAGGHRAGRGRLRGPHRHRLHRVLHLASGGDVPAGAAAYDRARLRGLRRALEPDPGRVRRRGRALRPRGASSEIAYDYWTTHRALEAVGHRPAFGLNFDPSHFVWRDLDPVGFLWDFRDRIYHVDCKRRGSGWTAATAGSARICPGATRGAAGTSSRPDTGMCRGRTCSGCCAPSDTTGRCRWSGRTPGWTGSRARRRRCGG